MYEDRSIDYLCRISIALVKPATGILRICTVDHPGPGCHCCPQIPELLQKGQGGTQFQKATCVNEVRTCVDLHHVAPLALQACYFGGSGRLSLLLINSQANCSNYVM